MKLKRLFLLAALALFGFNASAESGTIDGTNISWTLDNGTLTISGTGNIPNQALDGVYGVSHVVINEGITGIGNGVWYHTSVESPILTYDIPASVTTMNSNALYGSPEVTEITVHWTETTPTIVGNEVHFGIWGNNDVSTITLSVPFGTSALYEAAAEWQDFNIVERSTPDPDPTGINEVSETITITGYYSITGKKLDTAPGSGIYIIKYDNGKAEKVVK